MDTSSYFIPPFKGQSSNPAAAQALANNERLDREALTRRLSGNSLLDDARPTSLPMLRPRKRGASTSICLPHKGLSPWVSVPKHGQTASLTPHSEALSPDLLALEEGVSGSSMSSFSSIRAHPSTSQTTLPSGSRETSPPRLISRNSHVSKPSEKLKQLRRKIRNEELFKTLVETYGIDREIYPVTRCLSTSDLPTSQPVSWSPGCPRTRCNSTSIYQAPYNNSNSRLNHPTPNYRISSILGPITLPSPHSARAICHAAIADFDKTQNTLMGTWSQCCKMREFLPPIKDIWNEVYNLSFSIHLFTALTTTPPLPAGEDEKLLSSSSAQHNNNNHNWLESDARTHFMTWRTSVQKDRHRKLGITEDEDWAAADTIANNREKYPLSTRQLTSLTRLCFKASEMLWPLIKALKALARSQRTLQWARKTARWRLYAGLRQAVKWRVAECVRVARCPLVSWLRLGTKEACAALGIDEDKVFPGGEEEDAEVLVSGALQEQEEEEEEEEEDDDDIRVEDVEKKTGGEEAVLQRGEVVPRRLRMRFITLNARYHGLCLLPARFSSDKLAELAVHTTRVLQCLSGEDIGVGNGDDAAELHAKLRGLRRHVMKRALKAHPETIGLLDPVTRKMMSRSNDLPLHKRIVGGLRAGWASVCGGGLLRDWRERFEAWEKYLNEMYSVEEYTSAEETSREECLECRSSQEEPESRKVSSRGRNITGILKEAYS